MGVLLAYHRDRQDSLVLAALQGPGPVASPLTILQLVERLPDLPWRDVFQTVGRLQRQGAIVLLPRGFDFYVSLPEDATPLPDLPGGIHKKAVEKHGDIGKRLQGCIPDFTQR